MKNYRYLFLFFILSLYQDSIAQSKKELIKQQDSIYQANIKKSRLYGVYIPKDLNEAFAELDRLSTDEAITKFKSQEEEVVAKKLHFGIGKWIMHNWNLEEGSRYSHYLRNLGLVHLDDMVNFTLRSYHRHLTGKPQEVEARVQVYKDKRQAEEEERLKKAEVISNTTTIIKKN